MLGAARSFGDGMGRKPSLAVARGNDAVTHRRIIAAKRCKARTGNDRMKQYIFFAAAAIGLALPARADEGNAAIPTKDYAPRLADIMGATQLRHLKLSFAGKEQNWTLANYELGQIKISFQDAMRYYPNVPIADMTIMARPAAAIDGAIQSKDASKFAAAFTDLTAACNSCHRSQGIGFISMKVPTSSPFSNQSFAPK
jgi:hypothetical protein